MIMGVFSKRVRMKLNCDMGESFGPWPMGNDEQVMPYLDMANIACGFHASDPVTMDQTVKLAIQHNVEIGAHPGYPDLVGFGRRSMKCGTEEVKKMVIYQTGALQAFCQSNGTSLTYVKPHGMLNNDMMRDDELIQTIMQAIADYDRNIKLMIVTTPRWQEHTNMAENIGVELLYEAFADRLYDYDGQLTPRSIENSVHSDPALITQQVENMCEGFVINRGGEKIEIHADSICIHGDNPASIEAAAKINQLLHKI